MMDFKEFFLHEDKGNRNPSPQRKVHVSSSIAVTPPLPARDLGGPPRWKLKPIRVGNAVIPTKVDITRPTTAFSNG